MKLFRIIMICFLSVVLVLSLALNVFLLCGFRLSKGAAEAPTPEETVSDTASLDPRPKKRPQKEEKLPSVTVNEEEKPCEKEPALLIYEDENVRITYRSSKTTVDGPVYLFNIENTSKKTLTVLFCDLYINRRQVFISGLTCEHLLSDTESVGELVLMKKEWEQFAERPEKVSFKIKLQNDTSKLDLYETDRITLTLPE